MPTMYASGDHFEEMNGTIRGGVTVVMHNSSELPNVADLCMLASTSNAPMHALYGLFNATQLPESAPSRTYNWAELEGVDLGHPAQALATACSFAYDMWRRTPDPNAFFCSLTVARPERDMRLGTHSVPCSRHWRIDSSRSNCGGLSRSSAAKRRHATARTPGQSSA